jgi:hypothetical protein
VHFNPRARGEHDASLTIPSDTSSPTVVSLTGDGLASGQAFVNPSDENFGPVTVGESSAQTVTRINAGDTALSIEAASVNRSAAFSIAAGLLPCGEIHP